MDSLYRVGSCNGGGYRRVSQTGEEKTKGTGAALVSTSQSKFHLKES